MAGGWVWVSSWVCVWVVAMVAPACTSKVFTCTSFGRIGLEAPLFGSNASHKARNRLLERLISKWSREYTPIWPLPDDQLHIPVKTAGKDKHSHANRGKPRSSTWWAALKPRRPPLAHQQPKWHLPAGVLVVGAGEALSCALQGTGCPFSSVCPSRTIQDCAGWCWYCIRSWYTRGQDDRQP